jgi:hypothetical protein
MKGHATIQQIGIPRVYEEKRQVVAGDPHFFCDPVWVEIHDDEISLLADMVRLQWSVSFLDVERSQLFLSCRYSRQYEHLCFIRLGGMLMPPSFNVTPNPQDLVIYTHLI